ncbi:MAG: peptide/nickel transport system substrate-binding protein [Chloroflexota bacterium]|nr:peptide/nickel transport system substrate-binding protein [Chloroflexota bacterium]
MIDRVDATDPQTFTLGWKSPFISADAMFATAPTSRLRIMPLPRHLLGAAFQQDPTTLTQQPYWTSSYVGLGPFKLAEYVEGSHLLARANDRYALGRPKLDEVEVRFMADPSTIAANILAGTVELTLNSRLDIDWGVQLRDRWKDGHLEATQAGNFVGVFPQFIDPNPAILGNVAFREALMRAVDRQELSDSILAGMASPAHSLIGPGQPEYAAVDPSVAKFDYDPRQATQILDGMGLTKGPDGMYRDAAGQSLEIEIRAREGDALQEKMVPAVADFWKRAGINTKQFIFGAQLANDREFRATRPAFEVVRQPGGSDALSEYLSTATPSAENGYRGTNRTRYSSPEFDALINRYVRTIPEVERNQVLAQAISHMTRNIVVIGLDYSVDSTMIANRLIGPDAQNPAWNAHEWDVKQ